MSHAATAGAVPRRRSIAPAVRHGALRGLTLALTILALAALYELYHWVWTTTGWTKPFPVNNITLPHLWTILQALREPATYQGPALGTLLLHSAWFTAKEAFAGFAFGATVGFLLAVGLVHSRIAQRALLPYIVASQTIPILAIAPMVVAWLKTGWFSVAVIAAYLTFFPVTINTLRGLQSASPRAHELMRSYAASRFQVLVRLRIPTSLPYLFSALKVSATASVVGAIIGELASSIQGGLGGAIINFNQYYSIQPANLWATNLVAACLGIAFFLLIVLAEKLIVRRAPENVA